MPIGRRSAPSRLRFLAAVLLAAALGACGPKRLELVRVQRPDVKVLPGGGHVHPLTGVETYGDAPWEHRPVLAVKIGNTRNERPQAGVDKADLVYEELVEGGFTRLIAVFSSEDAPRVGPVRSARLPDPVILGPLHALLGYSGGVPQVVSAVRAKLRDVGAFSKAGAYHRDSSRRSPYNLYTSTDELWDGESGEPPGPQFAFLSSADPISGGGDGDATKVGLAFSRNTPVRYDYRARTGTYLRSFGDGPHTVEGTDGEGPQLAFRNVIVQEVQTRAGSYTDVAGNPVTDLDLTGSGQAMLFRGGRVFRGSWSRSSEDEPTRFLGADGTQLRLAPGRTMIELLPVGRDVSVS